MMNSIKRRIVLSAITVLTATFSLTTHAQNAATLNTFRFGVNGHGARSLKNNGQAELMDAAVPMDQQMKDVCAAGLKIYRMDVGDGEAGSLQKIGNIIDAAKRNCPNGLEVLPVLIQLHHEGDDRTLRFSDRTPATPEEAEKRGKDAAYKLAKAFGWLIRVYELGNEYDSEALAGNYDGDNISQFDRYRYEVIRANFKGMIAGVKQASHDLGFDGNEDRSLKTAMGMVWIHHGMFDQLYAEGIIWDISVLHWYQEMGDAENAGQFHVNLLQWMKNQYAGKPIWITEFGANVDAGTPERMDNKSAMMKTTVSMMQKMRSYESKYNVKAAIVYELYDTDETLAPRPESRFGLCEQHGHCGTQLYNAVKDYVLSGKVP